jgi:hypothetical protein
MGSLTAMGNGTVVVREKIAMVQGYEKQRSQYQINRVELALIILSEIILNPGGMTINERQLYMNAGLYTLHGSLLANWLIVIFWFLMIYGSPGPFVVKGKN